MESQVGRVDGRSSEKCTRYSELLLNRHYCYSKYRYLLLLVVALPGCWMTDEGIVSSWYRVGTTTCGYYSIVYGLQ